MRGGGEGEREGTKERSKHQTNERSSPARKAVSMLGQPFSSGQREGAFFQFHPFSPVHEACARLCTLCALRIHPADTFGLIKRRQTRSLLKTLPYLLACRELVSPCFVLIFHESTNSRGLLYFTLLLKHRAKPLCCFRATAGTVKTGDVS